MYNILKGILTERLFCKADLITETDDLQNIKKHKRTIACDLDGVIAEYDHFKGIEIIGNPIKSVIDDLKKEKDSGSVIIVYTARVNTQANPDYTVDDLVGIVKNYLDKNEVPYDTIWQGVGKPMADEYWDDRAVKKP